MEMEELYVICRANGAGKSQILMGTAPIPKDKADYLVDVMNDATDEWHHYASVDSDEMPDTRGDLIDCLDWMDID